MTAAVKAGNPPDIAYTSNSTPIAQQNRIEATLANVTSFAIDGTIGARASTRPAARLSRRHRRSDDDHDLGPSHAGFAAAGTYDGTICPSPGPAGLAGGAALLAALARRRKRARLICDRSASSATRDERGGVARLGQHEEPLADPPRRHVRRHGSVAVGLSPTFAFVMPSGWLAKPLSISWAP